MNSLIGMAGLVPAIQVVRLAHHEDADARHMVERNDAVLRTPVASMTDQTAMKGRRRWPTGF